MIIPWPKIQDLPPEACAQLAPALVKLRSQSETLAQGARAAPGAGDVTPNHGKTWRFPWKTGENLGISMENWVIFVDVCSYYSSYEIFGMHRNEGYLKRSLVSPCQEWAITNQSDNLEVPHFQGDHQMKWI